MCAHGVTNPGLPPEQFDSFDSDEESSDPVEDEHHMIFVCSGYNSTRALFPDLFGTDVSTVGQFLCQPNCNHVAKFLTWARMMRRNLA